MILCAHFLLKKENKNTYTHQQREFEDFVETRICKLRVILRSRVLWGLYDMMKDVSCLPYGICTNRTCTAATVSQRQIHGILDGLDALDQGFVSTTRCAIPGASYWHLHYVNDLYQDVNARP